MYSVEIRDHALAAGPLAPCGHERQRDACIRDENLRRTPRTKAIALADDGGGPAVNRRADEVVAIVLFAGYSDKHHASRNAAGVGGDSRNGAIKCAFHPHQRQAFEKLFQQHGVRRLVVWLRPDGRRARSTAE